MLSSACVVLALTASALGTVFITSPTASTTFTGGQEATITWMDDGKPPSLQDFGPASLSIYVGNAQQQTMLQNIVPSVNVATTASVKFTPDPTIGPNSNEYFIRVQSISLKDPAQPQYPALAFSSKFTMAGMSGTFNSTVQAQIDGQSTAPIGPSSSALSRPATTGAATTTGSSRPASSGSGTATASTSKPTKTNGAASLSVSSFTALAGLAAVFGLVL